MRNGMRSFSVWMIETVGVPGAALFAAAASWRFGASITILAALAFTAVVLGLTSPSLYAYAVLVLAPLPDVGAVIGVTIPFALEPFDLLLLIGACAVALRRFRPLVVPRDVVWLGALSYALFVAAWMRTYGSDGLSAGDLGLVAKPVLLVLAALIVVSIVPAPRIEAVVARGMAVGLLLVSLSVVLQRVGVYETAYQVSNAEALDIKQYGGLMLGGNSAGALVAIFALPTAVLLRNVGQRLLGSIVMLAAVPVLLVTLARGAILAFVGSLFLLAALHRRRAYGIRVAIVVSTFGAAWALTAGRAQVDLVVERIVRHSADRNAQLSGRLGIWEQAIVYLDNDRWLLGGGLDDFRTYALSSPLQHAFATHNAALELLTTGGALLLAVSVALVAAMWRSARGAGPIGVALRLSLGASVLVGLTADASLFNPLLSWIWMLLVTLYALGAARTSATRPVLGTGSHVRSAAP